MTRSILSALLLSLSAVACHSAPDATTLETDSVTADDIAGATYCSADGTVCLDSERWDPIFYTLTIGDCTEYGTLSGDLRFQPSNDGQAWYAAGTFGDGTLTLHTETKTFMLKQVN
jgi:hypothetical protein